MTDLNAYYNFTPRMHAAVLRGQPRLAVRQVLNVAEQSSASAEEAERLQGVVGQFKLG